MVVVADDDREHSRRRLVERRRSTRRDRRHRRAALVLLNLDATGATVLDTTIEQNRRFANLLGWSPGQLGAHQIDHDLVVEVRSMQASLGLSPDGVFGPKTYDAWLDRRVAELTAGIRHSDDPVRDAGVIALSVAKRGWLTSIIDPPSSDATYAASRRRIDAMIRTPDGLDWSWLSPYSRRNDFAWCGAFASSAWRAAGLALHWRRDFFSSTYRLDLWGRYLPFEGTINPRPARGPYRKWLALDERTRPSAAAFDPDDPPRAGDLLLVGPAGSDFGSHVTMVESYDASNGVFTTIEGNGVGAWPSGARVRGVVRGRRSVGLAPGAPPTTYHARRLIRPAFADLAAAG